MEDFVIKCEFCQQTPFEVVESNCCSTIYCWNCILEKKICKCGSIINIEKVAVVPELQVSRNILFSLPSSKTSIFIQFKGNSRSKYT